MRFKPVYLPADRRPDGKASQTFLRHFDRCPRSGYLYQLHKGEAQTAAMVRGSAFHEIAERATNAMIEQGEAQIPDDVVKAITTEVLGELPVPTSEHDLIRELAYRWSAEWMVNPAAVIACETLIVLELEDWQVRCKIDFAEATEGGMAVRVADYKTSRAAPGYEDLARRRPDGSLSAKSFQLVLYALALAYGLPTRVEEGRCESCDGSTFFAGEFGGDPCPECDATGIQRIETPEPFPLAAQAERFDLSLVFPAIENRDGLMVRRGMSLNRLELGEYRDSLAATLRRLTKATSTGDWPAVVSDEACNECPCRPECPIPAEVRDHAGEINSVDDAREAAESIEIRSAELTALRAELKRFAKGNDVEIRYGRDKAWRFGFQTSDRIERKDQMWEAIDRAVQYGEPFERSQFVRTVESTTFKPVTLAEDEL